MKVIQLLTTLKYGDAVGNDVIALDGVIKKMGFETCIYADEIGNRIPKNMAKLSKYIPKLKEDDVIIYHMAIASDLTYLFAKSKAKKVLIYHNVTPAIFFDRYDKNAAKACNDGLEQVKFLSDKVDYCLADSEYNKQQLLDMNYKCPINVLPILIPFEDYEKTPSENIISKYKNDGYTNIIFTGRIAPNKKQEDIILAFDAYQKLYNKKSRLIIIGSGGDRDIYYRLLKKYVSELGNDNVIFTGHISFDEILAYYSLADIFLCMSEHEGFCIPLVEAMKFEIPVIAYDSSAISETGGNAVFLLEKKDPVETAGVIDYIINNPHISEQLVRNGKKRVDFFATDKIENMFVNYMNEIIQKG